MCELLVLHHTLRYFLVMPLNLTLSSHCLIQVWIQIKLFCYIAPSSAQLVSLCI